MLLQVLFLKDLSFAICEKMAPISSWEPKQFLFNFKGKISWGKKKKSLPKVLIIQHSAKVYLWLFQTYTRRQQ